MSPSSVTPRRSPHHQEDVIERVRARARAANLRVARVSAARLARERQLASRLARRLAAADANRDALMRRRVETAARRTQESRVARFAATRAATRVQRAWRRFALGSFASGSFASGSQSLARKPPGAASPSTTFALARRFASARVTLDANRRDFDAYAEILQRPETLRATRALLARTHARLIAGGVNLAADPACAALRRCLEPPKERGKRTELLRRRIAERPNCRTATSRFPTRGPVRVHD